MRKASAKNLIIYYLYYKNPILKCGWNRNTFHTHKQSIVTGMAGSSPHIKIMKFFGLLIL